MRARITRRLQRVNRRQWIAVSLTVLVIIAACLVILWRSASAATIDHVVPDSLLGSWTGVYTSIDEGAEALSSDYINTGTSDPVSATMTFGTIVGVGTATSVTLHICAYSDTNANGGTLDTLHNTLSIGGTQPVYSMTPAYSSIDSCTWYEQTYTGSWSQSDIDSILLTSDREVVGSGNPSRQIDDIRIASVYVAVTYSVPSEVSQAAYRWFANDIEAGDGTFAPKVDYPAVDGPEFIATSDLNGDQVADIVVSNNTGDTISVFLGNGDGTFAPKVDYPTGDAPEFIATSDLNGDQVADIVVSNNTGDTISVFLGNGDGTLAPKVDYPAGDEPSSVALGDLNGDQIIDVVTANYIGGTISAFIGNGDGTLAPKVDYPTDIGPSSVALGDLNGDQIIDVVTANRLVDTISVFIGNGDGTLAPKVDYPASNASQSVALSDLNGDQIIDIVTADNAADTISVFLGNGDGTFVPKVDYPTDEDPYFVALSDLNGDQITDVVTVNDFSDTISVFLGNGDGTFAPKVDYPAGNGPLSVALSDLNGDQIIDIVTANNIGDTISVLLGKAAPTGPPLADNNTAAIAPTDGTALRLRLNLGVSVGDLGEGASFKLRWRQKFDATCSTNPSIYEDVTASTPVQFYDNSALADGSAYSASTLDPVRSGVTAVGQSYEESNPFSSTATIPAGQDGLWDFALTVGDTATAGKYCLMATKTDNTALNSYAAIPEITVESSVEQASYRWFANKSSHGTGKFPLQLMNSPNVAGGPWALASADFNGDGITDIATGNVISMTVSILLGDGNGDFTVNADYLVGGQVWSLATADFNGDSIADIATANNNGNSTSILIGNGDGTFAPRYDYPVGTAPHGVIAADFNGDQIADIATVNSGVNTISVLLGDGNGLFSSAVAYPVGTAPDSLTSADFNGDQILDIVITNYNDGTVSVLLGMGDGTFAAKVDYATGIGPYSVVTADFNGDQVADIATANYSDDTISVLLGVGNGTFGAKVDYATDSFPQSLTSADFNGDGITDIATANNTDFTTSILLGNGDGTFGAKADYFIGSGPTMIISADFNNDQIIDLASAHYGGNFINIAQNRPGAPDEALADSNTVVTAPEVGTAFRLRLNLGVSDVGLRTGTSYKLRYQLKSGATCSANPLDYSDVTTSSPIQFYDNSSLVDGLVYIASALDPVRSGVTAVGQSYEESSSFSVTAVIPAGQDGLWDFAVTMDEAAPSGSYCLMATQADNTALNTYTVIPEVTYTAPGPATPTLQQQLRGGQAVVNGLKSPFNW